MKPEEHPSIRLIEQVQYRVQRFVARSNSRSMAEWTDDFNLDLSRAFQEVRSIR